MAFMPSGVMSMLSVKNRFLNMHESKLGKNNVWFYLFKDVSCARGQSPYKMRVCVKSFLIKCAVGLGHFSQGLLCSGSFEWIHLMTHFRYHPKILIKTLDGLNTVISTLLYLQPAQNMSCLQLHTNINKCLSFLEKCNNIEIERYGFLSERNQLNTNFTQK